MFLQKLPKKLGGKSREKKVQQDYPLKRIQVQKLLLKMYSKWTLPLYLSLKYNIVLGPANKVDQFASMDFNAFIPVELYNY